MTKCLQCNNTKKFWKLKDNRFRCISCRYTFTLKRKLPKLSKKIVKKVITEFILGHSTNTILSRVKIPKFKLLKVLTLLRIVMMKDIPEIFSGIVEVDETYLGGQMKNQRQKTA